MLAVKSVHFEKGTLLSYHNVTLTEEGWKSDEYAQAQRRETLKSAPIDYFIPGIHVGNQKATESSFANSSTFPTETLEPGFEVADENTEEGQLKLSNALDFLAKVDTEANDAGTLRMMAVEIEKDEKVEEQI